MANPEFCRLCGHEDTPDFCSRCGLPLGPGEPLGIVRYVLNRVRVLATPIPRFIWTTALLLLRPVTFFETLNQRHCGLHQIRLLRGFQASASFAHWRRPTTPQNYFLFALLLPMVTLARLESGSPRPDLGADPLGTLLSLLQPTVSLLLFDSLFVVLLYCQYQAYRMVLGLNNSRGLMEYVLYTFSLVYMPIMPIVVLASEFLFPAELPALVPLYCLLVGCSYYFVLVPLLLRGGFFPVSVVRVIISFFVMLFLPLTVLLLIGCAATFGI